MRYADKNKNNYLLKPRYRYYNRVWYRIRQRLDPQPDNGMKWNPVLDTDIYRLTKSRIWKKIPLEESIHHSYMKPDSTYEWAYLGIKMKYRLEWLSGGVITFNAILDRTRTSLTSYMKPFRAPETVGIEQGCNNNANRKTSNVEP